MSHHQSATLPVTLNVNGRTHSALVEPRHTLLDTLRDDLHLTGAKKVCDMGNCGACTVIVDGKAVYSCLTLTVDCDGCRVTTIEGLADGQQLDPLQEAFIASDAFQCGYCTAGQIMSLKAMFDATSDASEEDIRRAVSGNLCRCGAYANIVRAGMSVAADRRVPGSGSTGGGAK